MLADAAISGSPLRQPAQRGRATGSRSSQGQAASPESLPTAPLKRPRSKGQSKTMIGRQPLQQWPPVKYVTQRRQA